jgi:hypothetical protein
MATLEEVLEVAARKDVAALRALLAPSMPAVKRALAERGRSVHIALAAEHSNLAVQAASLLACIEMRRAGQLDVLEFWYIFTAVDLHLVENDLHGDELGGVVSALAERELDEPTLRRMEVRLLSVAT